MAKVSDFGVVLFEVLCVRPVVDGSMMKEHSLRGTETKAMQCYAEVVGEGSEIRMRVVAFCVGLGASSENGEFDEAMLVFKKMLAEAKELYGETNIGMGSYQPYLN